MTILERLARIAPYVQAERKVAGNAAAEKKQEKPWGSFDKWNDSPVFGKSKEERTIMATEIMMESAIRRVSPLSEEDAKKQAHILRVFADPTRLQLISFLARYEDEVCVKEIVECFPLAQPTISHHMRILREAGIVDVRKRALYAYYFLRRDVLAQTRGIIWALSEREG